MLPVKLSLKKGGASEIKSHWPSIMKKSLISISCLQYKVYPLIMSSLLRKCEQFVSSL